MQQRHPDTKKWRTKPFIFYDDMIEFIRGTVATGAHAFNAALPGPGGSGGDGSSDDDEHDGGDDDGPVCLLFLLLPCCIGQSTQIDVCLVVCR